MDFFTRTRTLVFIIILLLCMNIAMLFLFFFGRPEPLSRPERRRDPVQDRARIEYVLKEELGFEKWQIERFNALRSRHKDRMRELKAEMRRLKELMFDQAMLNAPEARLSDSLLVLTQETQNNIERQTFTHLLDIKQLCTPTQREKLNVLLRELLRPDPQRDDASSRSGDRSAAPKSGK